MRTGAFLSAVAALLGGAHAHAQTTYAVVEMHHVDGVHSSAFGIDPKGRILTVNNGALDSIKYGALCTPASCKNVGPKKRQFGWLFLGPDHRFAGQVWYGDVAWASYRSTAGVTYPITPGAAWGINSHDQVVGDTSTWKPFSSQAGTLTTLPTLGGAHGSARSITEGGVIVGESEVASGKMHATKWINGVAQDLGVHPEAGSISSARSINGLGVIVGCADRWLNPKMQAAKFEGDTPVILGNGSFGQNNSACAASVNDQGVIVGWSTVLPDADTHAFIMEGSTMVDLNDRIPAVDKATYKLLYATAVNAKGQISVTAKRLTDLFVVALRLDPVAP